MKRKIRVLIADDHEIVCAGLASVIDIEDDMRCVGTASNGEEAVARAVANEADVVIMDLMMPVMNGIEATRRVMAVRPDARVLILTTFGSACDLRSALDAGARGALLKSTPNREIVAAIRRIVAGERVVADDIESLFREEPPLPQLSERQVRILEAVTRGFSNQDIAKMMSTSYATIKRELAIILAKLGAATRAEAASIALRNNVLGK